MIYDCLSSTFYILRPFLTNYPEIKRHKETFSNYMESYPTIKHLAPLCIAFIHHMRQRTLIMRYEAFWPCPSRLFFKCILTMYVRQFCFMYLLWNQFRIHMKDEMQHNSGNYSSDQIAKQKWKIFCSSSKKSTDNAF